MFDELIVDGSSNVLYARGFRWAVCCLPIVLYDVLAIVLFTRFIIESVESCRMPIGADTK